MLQIGIVGLPNVGKSTLFKAVTNKQIDIQNYPFTTIEPNVGVVEVPDERVDRLAELSSSAKQLYATVEFTDIAGLVKGASTGEGLGNKFLANIREVGAVAQVVRVFNDPNVTHVHGQVDAATDIGVINTELVLADLDSVVKRLEATKKKIHTDKEAKLQVPILERLAEELQRGTLISTLKLSEAERELTSGLNLLTDKPFIYVINISEGQLAEGWQPPQDLLDAIGGSSWIMMSNKLELELSEVSKEEKNQLLKELDLPESGLDQLITTAYRTLGLISFLTTGEKESRAWTCKKGSTAPVAASAIHTDFERLFIRAHVIAYDELITAGSYAKARELGKVRTEGKEYVVQDGDVIEVLIG
jgi:GTP-binding protein YchF